MTAILNEPKAEYRVIGWLPQYNKFPFDENISGIENKTVLLNLSTGSITQIGSHKPKKKLSLLRGKMTKQSEKEIDDQISDLRSEWDRSINVLSVVGNKFCVKAEDGEKVYELIKKAISEKRKIELSFSDIELLLPVFLNAAIGDLYKDFPEEEIEQYLSVKDLTRSGTISLRNVIETSIDYFKDPEAFEKTINEILDE
jgi:hypothetical protein